MLGIPLRIYVLFFASVAFQILAMTLLPRSRGFTVLLPTVGCAALFICGIWMIARMYQSGAKLGIMSPLLAAIIPLGVIAVVVAATAPERLQTRRPPCSRHLPPGANREADETGCPNATQPEPFTVSTLFLRPPKGNWQVICGIWRHGGELPRYFGPVPANRVSLG